MTTKNKIKKNKNKKPKKLPNPQMMLLINNKKIVN